MMSSSRLYAGRAFMASQSFSTSARSCSNRVPPESPAYIRLPQQPQSDETKPSRPRGHLPVPRQVFPRLEGDRKIKPEYMQQTAPTSTRSQVKRTETQLWKTAMADKRRANLEEGLHSLWARRSEMDKSRHHRVSRNFEANNKAATAAEREDDRITRSTVLGSMLDTKVYADPNRFARIDRSRTRIAARENARREARQDALMELYISASNFIVHESELKAEIDKVFADDYFRKQSQTQNSHVAENTWGVYGKPPSIANMTEMSTGTSTKVMHQYESEYDRSVKRQKRIAEDLTGGKME